MELRVYDAQMNFKGLVENQTSVLWNRRYSETGSFEIHLPVTGNNIALIQRGNLVWKRGSLEAGVIEEVIIEQTNFKNEIKTTGRFLESYMSRRLIRPTYYAQNKLVETAMREILSNAVSIPLVQLGEVQGFTERVTFQATYKSLLDYEEKLSAYSNIGFRFRPDFTEKTITFELYKGLDRSSQQTDRARVVFSEAYNNVHRATYNENDQLMKNVCYVGGEGEGESRVYATAGDDTLEGLERREMFTNASDLRSEGLTSDEYKAVLIQRGNDTLEKNTLSTTFECETAATSNFVYKKHYDLGDIVTVKKENWGIEVDLRMTEITEIYENGEMRVSPVFGTPIPAKIDWSDTDNG